MNSNKRVGWIEIPISTRNDLDFLFYLINLNPVLCQYTNTLN